jgi:hypothetical protein
MGNVVATLAPAENRVFNAEELLTRANSQPVIQPISASLHGLTYLPQFKI